MTLDTNYKRRIKLQEEKREKEYKDNKFLYTHLKSKGLYKDEEGQLSTRELLNRFDNLDGKRKNKSKEYRTYYPISSSSVIYKIGDKESQQREGIASIDKSYIDACIEICKDILAHEKEELEGFNGHGKGNVQFAKEFLGKMGFDEYKSNINTLDKYDLLDQIRQYATDLTDNLGSEYEHKGFNYNEAKGNGWILYLNDTKYNSYADNKYYFYARIEDSSKFPKGYYNSPEDLKSTYIYNDLKSAISNIFQIDDVKSISFYFDNVKGAAKMNMTISADRNSKKRDMYDKSGLRKSNFMVGSTYIALELDKLPFILRTPKPQGNPGSYHSVVKDLEILDKSWTKLKSFPIDERGFNSINCSSKKDQIYNWVISQHEEMKKSNPDYGYGKREGSKNLYVHDFMIWLKDNQDKYEKN